MCAVIPWAKGSIALTAVVKLSVVSKTKKVSATTIWRSKTKEQNIYKKSKNLGNKNKKTLQFHLCNCVLLTTNALCSKVE